MRVALDEGNRCVALTHPWPVLVLAGNGEPVAQGPVPQLSGASGGQQVHSHLSPAPSSVPLPLCRLHEKELVSGCTQYPPSSSPFYHSRRAPLIVPSFSRAGRCREPQPGLLPTLCRRALPRVRARCRPNALHSQGYGLSVAGGGVSVLTTPSLCAGHWHYVRSLSRSFSVSFWWQ